MLAGSHSPLGLRPAGWVDRAMWLLGRRRRVRISGPSMEPTLRHGDVVYVAPATFRRRPPRAGDIVLAKHAFRNDVLTVKRVSSVLRDGRTMLEGDNPAASTDSRTLGAVRADRILGCVTAVVRS